MKGLYRGATENTFVSDDEIRRWTIIDQPTFEIPIKENGRDFHEWTAKTKRRQREYLETQKTQEKGKVRLPQRSLVSFMADLHIGGAYTDYARIEEEAHAIVATPFSYVVLLGDLVDAFYFNPAQMEDIEQTPEQIEYARSLVRYLAENNKLLAVLTGNHDRWVAKMGFDPYKYIMEGVEAYYFHGQSKLDVEVDKQEYRMVLNHMHKGNSIYNNAHPQNRAVRFGGAFGADLVVSGHWHQKGIAQQVFSGYEEDHLTTMMALGTYKSTDEYIKTYGFTNRSPIEMFGSSVLLDDAGHRLQPYWDIVEANQVFSQYE